MHEDDSDEEFSSKSKTQVKKEMLALQDLGEQLTKLPADQLDKIPLSDSLREAIEQARRITKHGAAKRHKQFIGRLMRESDPDAIVDAYNQIEEERNRHARQHHLVEKWRDDLIQGDDEKLHQFINIFPHCDRQQLRHLVAGAKREAAENKTPVNARKLFKYIRDVLI